MTRCLHRMIALLVLGLVLPFHASAQSDGSDTPLGDVARSLRKSKVETPPAKIVIDNDNFSQVMADAESRHVATSVLRFSLGEPGRAFQMASPDVTCSLSFSAQGPNSNQAPASSTKDLPEGELAKLEGPAAIVGDLLQVSLYNGTEWDIREITVSLTIVRRPGATAQSYGPVRLVPASSTVIMAKRSDLTVLFHLKGSAAPNTTTVFQDSLRRTLSPDQEWHWAIVQAKGIPPR